MVKSRSQVSPDQTVIAPGVQARGRIVCRDDLWFGGTLVGDIDCGGNVVVGPTAEIEGNISATNLSIAGKVRGQLKVKNRLEIGQQAQIQGDIEARDLSLDSGATLIGSVKMPTAQGASDSGQDGAADV